MKTLPLCVAFCLAIGCGDTGPVPQGTYEGAVARNVDCPFDIDYRITLFYDGSLLEGSEFTHFMSDYNDFSVNLSLKGAFAPGDEDFILERISSTGVVQNSPAVFRFKAEQLSLLEECGSRSVYVPLVHIR